MSDLVVQKENNIDPMLSMIERVALDPQADVLKLEKMIELQERVMANQAKQQFDQAMLNFQIKKPVIEKNAVANRTKYAKLPNIQAAIEPVLQEFGLFARWSTVAQESGKTRVTCIVTHIGGHSETSSMDVSPDKSGSKNEIQAEGSAITYAERYTLCSLLGLVLSEDTDGNSVKPTITAQQVKILEKKLNFLGDDAKSKMVAHIGCELHEIEKAAFDYWCGKLDSSVAKKEAKQ
ncbi:MAG: ERF family protein [Acinetobacter sp.]